MNPRIYNKAPNIHGVLNTHAHKQAVYRQAVKLGMTLPEYRKHQEREFKRLYAFLYTKDYGRAAAAYKRAMQEAHPDHGGDVEQAQRIIAAWDQHKKSQGWSGTAPTVTNPYTHHFTGVVTPVCLMRAGKRAKVGERFNKAVGAPPTCPACLAAVAASALKLKADVKPAEDEFNARRQKEMEAATARCNHTDPKDDDCLICFPVDDEPTVTPRTPQMKERIAAEIAEHRATKEKNWLKSREKFFKDSAQSDNVTEAK